ncbi:MAG TPA: YncE family protein [Phycisphaerae bacterium]|nr:YncE family protein [Phycisphaerae bacterium]
MKRVISRLVLLAATLMLTNSAFAADAVPPLKVIKTIPTGSTGRWDYIYVDPASHRLYVPRSNHVQIVDLEKGEVIGDIPGTNGVHGVALAPEQNLGFASDGRDNAVTVFDLKTLKTVGSPIKAGKNPDAIIYDPASKHILAMCHSGGVVTVIDPAALDKDPVTIDVGGKLEFAAADGVGHVFVNVEDKSEVVEIDSKANRVLAHWPLAPGEGPTGLAIDTEHHRLFAGCDGSSKMIVLDSDSGKVLGAVDIGKGVDGVAFSPAFNAAISANGEDGTLSVVQETSPGKYEVVQTPKTIRRARTITVDTSTNHILLPTTDTDGKTFVIAVVGAEQK